MVKSKINNLMICVVTFVFFVFPTMHLQHEIMTLGKYVQNLSRKGHMLMPKKLLQIY